MTTRDPDSSPPPRDLPPVRKSLGQHFLNDRNILGRIVDALALTGEETVIEIGPGRGSLTELLVPRVRALILIEYDRALAARLRETYAPDAKVRVIQADVLTVPLREAAGAAYSVVGNVPYYISTPIIFHALEHPRAERAVFLLQREVAERMAAPAGASEYGALSANVQAVARVEVLFRVAPGSFQPPPQVESAVVRLSPRVDPVISTSDEEDFRAFVQAAFGMRRKQIRRVLREVAGLSVADANAALEDAGIDGEARPETLTPADFARLARASGRI
ncbi:MAG: 16S rRNA (adenine(1518)-N(6)/adenine(1519)-N(6))-dimethyltransferase RsmA [Gemmatimonadales bacterium]